MCNEKACVGSSKNSTITAKFNENELVMDSSSNKDKLSSTKMESMIYKVIGNAISLPSAGNVSSTMERRSSTNGSSDLTQSILFSSNDTHIISKTSIHDIRMLLDSSNEHDNLTAMRTIMQNLAKGQDRYVNICWYLVVCSLPMMYRFDLLRFCCFFLVRKLVSLYLIRYAEEHQELALLPFASLQNLLKMSNPIVRSMAINVLSNMRVLIVIPVVVLCLKNAVKDLSPLVRRSVALAIPKLFSQDNEQYDRLLPMLEQLIADRSVFVLGGALRAFRQFCPNQLSLIHTHFRRICILLPDFDEWMVVDVLQVLTLYTRTYFPCTGNIESSVDSSATSENVENSSDKASNPVDSLLNHDMLLLVSNARIWLYSQNSAAVCAAADLLVNVAPIHMLSQITVALIHRLTSNSKEMHFVLLKIIISMIRRIQKIKVYIKHLKLQILILLSTEQNVSSVLSELQAVSISYRSDVVIFAIRAMGQLCCKFQVVNHSCQSFLLDLLHHSKDEVRSECIVILKGLIQQDPKQCEPVLSQFMNILNTLQNPDAIATILWLIGAFSDNVVSDVGVKVLKDVILKWDKQALQVKYQALSLAAKLYSQDSCHFNTVLFKYALKLARFRGTHDLRDRAAFLEAMFLHPDRFPTLYSYRKSILMNNRMLKSSIRTTDCQNHSSFTINSMSHALAIHVPGYINIPKCPSTILFANERNVKFNDIADSRQLSTNFCSADISMASAYDRNSHSNGEYVNQEEHDDGLISTEGPDNTDTDISCGTTTSTDGESTDFDGDDTKINKRINVIGKVSRNINRRNLKRDEEKSPKLVPHITDGDISSSISDYEHSELNNTLTGHYQENPDNLLDSSTILNDINPISDDIANCIQLDETLIDFEDSSAPQDIHQPNAESNPSDLHYNSTVDQRQPKDSFDNLINSIFADMTSTGQYHNQHSHIDTSCLNFVTVHKFVNIKDNTNILLQYAELKPQVLGTCNLFFRTKQQDLFSSEVNILQSLRIMQLEPLLLCKFIIFDENQFSNINELPNGNVIVKFVNNIDDRYYNKKIHARVLNSVDAGNEQLQRECKVNFGVKLGPISYILPQFINNDQFERAKGSLRGMCEYTRYINKFNRRSYLPFQSFIHQVIRRIGFAVVLIMDTSNQEGESVEINCAEENSGRNSNICAKLSGTTVLTNKQILVTLQLSSINLEETTHCDGSGNADDAIQSQCCLSMQANCELPLFANCVLDELKYTIEVIVDSKEHGTSTLTYGVCA
ncbi:hypothetical protein GJ496_008334 [Pomphorhynchus laevis]|nr:hypothetical protein GJ496_008334 [Pomphorhynchus laevis]